MISQKIIYFWTPKKKYSKSFRESSENQIPQFSSNNTPSLKKNYFKTKKNVLQH